MAQLVARLVRNEKVGGSNPPSSTTDRHPIADVGFLYAWARSCGACCCVDWCRWCSGRLLGRVVGPGRCVCRWAAARPRAVCAASFARRVAAKPGQAPPPPTGTAAWPSGLSVSVRIGNARLADQYDTLSRCPTTLYASLQYRNKTHWIVSITPIGRNGGEGSHVLLTRRCNERVCAPDGYMSQCIGLVVAGSGSTVNLAGLYGCISLYNSTMGTFSSCETSCDCH